MWDSLFWTAIQSINRNLGRMFCSHTPFYFSMDVKGNREKPKNPALLSLFSFNKASLSSSSSSSPVLISSEGGYNERIEYHYVFSQKNVAWWYLDYMKGSSENIWKHFPLPPTPRFPFILYTFTLDKWMSKWSFHERTRNGGGRANFQWSTIYNLKRLSSLSKEKDK